jgi:MSHA biogenesis protein MshI
LLTITFGGELYLARRLEITSGQLQDANETSRQQYLERVELEVQRSMDYFDRQFHHITLGRMIVSIPMGSGLLRMLADNFGLPVEALDLSQVLDISAAPALLENEFLTEALPAVGAALRQERRAL